MIELTSRCNYACDFCYNRFKNKELSVEYVFEILIDAKKSGVLAIRFTGGEPFLYPNLKDVLIKARELGFKVILNTNGSYIDKSNIQYLDYIDILLLSFHDFKYIDLIKEKIRLINQYPVDIMIATIASSQVIIELEKYYDFIKSLSYPVNWFLLRQLPNKNNIEPVSFEEIVLLLGKVKKYGLNIANSIPFCIVPNSISKLCSGGIYDRGHSRLLIDSAGNYCVDYMGDVLGNITKDSILDIWNSKILNTIRNDVRIECKECYHYTKCLGALGKGDYLIDVNNVRPLVSVIIPTYNNSKSLDLVIKSLKNQNCKKSVFEIIVVDDGSNDNTKEVVLNHGIRYYFQEDLGFRAGQARNLGALHAKGKILIFLDDDSITHSDFIKNHLMAHTVSDIVLGYNSSYGTFQFYTKNQIQDFLNNTYVLPIIKEFRHIHFFNYPNRPWMYFASGNMSIKKRIFDKFLFDNDLVGWAEEDVDLGYRLYKAGFKLVFNSNCIAYNIREKVSNHHPFLTRKKYISTTKNQMQLYKKYRTEEIKDYIRDRYKNTPLIFRNGTNIDFDRMIFEVSDEINN